MMGAAMNIRTLILCFGLLLAAPLLARENTDLIEMDNGDRLTGTVKGLDAGVLYFSLPYAVETISIDWSIVVRLESSQLFLVKMQDGTVYTGKLNTTQAMADGPMKIQVAGASGKEVVLDSSQIVTVGQTSEKFLQ